MKIFYKALSSGLLALSVFSCSPFVSINNCKVNAYSISDFNNVLSVSTSNELVLAVENAKDGDCIVLHKNLVLNRDIEINKSITLDLNGYNIDVGAKAYQISCGSKKFDHIEYYTVNHPPEVKKVNNPKYVNGGWYIDSNGISQYRSEHYEDEIKTVVIPAWQEKCSKNVYVYRDDMKVKIRNGIIFKNTNDVYDKKQDDKYSKFEDTCGKDGATYRAPVNIISGTVYLQDANILGCNGQDGQDGCYQKLWHTPIFSGGRGGNGGNGGNGSHAVFIERNEAKVVIAGRSFITGGNGGKAGKGSKANPNYWIVSSKSGKDGKEGKKQAACNLPDRLIYV